MSCHLQHKPERTPPLVAQDLLPETDSPGPVGHTGVPAKFDEGFYEDVLTLLLEEPLDGAPGVYDGKLHRNVIVVVSRDDGDDRNPDIVSRENRAEVVERLERLGARDIVAAESLSFVTATIPVAEIPGLSVHDEIYRMGDGEQQLVLSLDRARETIHATNDELRMPNGAILNGSGVVVGVLDFGINHASLNDKVIDRVLCTTSGCNSSTTDIINGRKIPRNITSSHGTSVAQVIASSGLPASNGIAPGVSLIDAIIGIHPNNSTAKRWAHALDHAHRNGADVVNLSFGSIFCSTIPNITTVNNLILNEAVDKGMVAVNAAGNNGTYPNNPQYESTVNPGCGSNTITVGGINDRGDEIKMFASSSRGPTDNMAPVLKPEVVAPAYRILLLATATDNFLAPHSGTSYAAPQVTATAALLLQAVPDMTPVEIKAAVLVGANWTGPIPCTSAQYEQNDTSSGCSYARQPTSRSEAHNAASLNILNNVGFGILNVNRTLEYATHNAGSHVLGGHLSSDTDSRMYRFNVTDTSEPVKVILTWMAHPHGGILEQSISRPINIADLDFTLACPGKTIVANSTHQTNEFVVFTPNQTGVCHVTVNGTGIGEIVKPVQNYAIASTLPLLEGSNEPPTALPRTIIIDPTYEDPAIVWLRGTDPDGDSITFHISSDPVNGTLSTDEFITKTESKALYTQNSGFLKDSFEVTPHDGTISGTSANMTILAESLPPSLPETGQAPDKMQWTDALKVGTNPPSGNHTWSFSGPPKPASAILVDSEHLEGAYLLLSTSEDNYIVAIPPSGSRSIEFTAPLEIQSATLSADGTDEEAVPGSRDIEMLVKYDLCQTVDGDTTCPANEVSQVKFSPSLEIPDGTGLYGASDNIDVSTNATIGSISISIDMVHPRAEDLKITLMSPNRERILLHNLETDNSTFTYNSTSHTALGSLVNTTMAGNWILLVEDYTQGGLGTINGWSMKMTILDTLPSPPEPEPPAGVVLFSDDFEARNLDKWVATGELDWETERSPSHGVPAVPNSASSNDVLHGDNCDEPCVLTLKDALDLTTGYGSATLSFWRFVDDGLDRDEHLRVEAYDGAGWNTLAVWSEDNGGADGEWHMETYDLTSYLATNNFKIRISMEASSDSEDVQLDNINVTAVPGTPPTPPTVLFSDDFESYSLDSWFEAGYSQWTVESSQSQPYPEVPGGQPENAVLHADRCRSVCILTLWDPVDLTGYDSANLTFWRFVDSSLSSSEYLKVEAYNGTSWETVYYWSGGDGDDDTWHLETLDLISYLNSTDFKIKFTMYGRSSSDDVNIDDVMITALSDDELPPPRPRSVPLFSDEFESLDSWSASGRSNWEISTPNVEGFNSIRHHPATNTVLHADSCLLSCVLTLTNALNLTGYDSAHLSFLRVVDRSLSGDEHLKIEAFDGTSWNTLYHWSDSLGGNDHTWHRESYNLSEYLGTDAFKIRLSMLGGSSNDDVQLDDMLITVVPGETTTNTVLFADDFRSTPLPSTWSSVSGDAWVLSTPDQHDIPAISGQIAENRVLHADDCDVPCVIQMKDPINLATGYDSASLSLERYVDSSLSGSEYFRVEAYNGIGWSILGDISPSSGGNDGTWHSESYDLGTYLNVTDFKIRLAASMDSRNDDVQVDNILISATIGPGGLNGTSRNATSTTYSYAIYVTSEDTHSIKHYLPDGTYVDNFVAASSGGLASPWGLAFGPDDHLYVSDTSTNSIMRYNQSGAPAGVSSSNATWARTLSEPYGIVWHNSTLYVSSYYGVERFNSTGTSLGYYGDASYNPPPGQTRVFLSYDTALGTDDMMYVSVIWPSRILVYSASDGTFNQTLSTTSTGLQYINGLAWDPVEDALLAAGDDPGRVVRFGTPSHDIYSSLLYIDGPYGMDVAPDGTIYVAVKDDESVSVINGTSISRLFASGTGNLDDPRDVVIGPAIAAGAGTAGAEAATGVDEAGSDTRNSEPEFELYAPDGTPVRLVEVAQSANTTLTVSGSDADGDAISYRLEAAPDFLVLTPGTEPNTAILRVNATGVNPGAYPFKIVANDGIEDEWTGYAVLIEEEGV